MSVDGLIIEPSPPTTSTDELLLPWLQASDRAQAQDFLARLISEHAVPTIHEIVAYRLKAFPKFKAYSRNSQDAEDLCHEIVLQLLAKLTHFKEAGEPPINNFRGYVATVAHHACSMYWRQQHPQRTRLKDQLRYVLHNQRGFALWEAGNKVWLSGYEAWREQGKTAVPQRRVRALQDDPSRIEANGSGKVALTSLHFSDLLAAIFNQLGSPVEFTALVNLVAALRGIKDYTEQTPNSEGGLESAPDQRTISHADRIEQRLYLERLWLEICQLPLPHRRALLLNLRAADDRGLVVLLVELRITTLHQLAEVLELPPLEFAELWRELPLEDTRIAGLLKLTRQQVINLRSSARRQLANRMRAVTGGY